MALDSHESVHPTVNCSYEASKLCMPLDHDENVTVITTVPCPHPWKNFVFYRTVLGAKSLETTELDNAKLQFPHFKTAITVTISQDCHMDQRI